MLGRAVHTSSKRLSEAIYSSLFTWADSTYVLFGSTGNSFNVTSLRKSLTVEQPPFLSCLVLMKHTSM
jgi:hypothetical protein